MLLLVVISFAASIAFLPAYSILQPKIVLPTLAYAGAMAASFALTAMLAKSSGLDMHTFSNLGFVDVVRPVSLRVVGIVSLYLLATSSQSPSLTFVDFVDVLLRASQALSVLYLVSGHYQSSFLRLKILVFLQCNNRSHCIIHCSRRTLKQHCCVGLAAHWSPCVSRCWRAQYRQHWSTKVWLHEAIPVRSSASSSH
jgi:hypothetical protein